MRRDLLIAASMFGLAALGTTGAGAVGTGQPVQPPPLREEWHPPTREDRRQRQGKPKRRKGNVQGGAPKSAKGR